MMKHFAPVIAGLTALFCSVAFAANKEVVLSWDSLLPEEEAENMSVPDQPIDHEGDSQAEQIGSSAVVEELDGQYVRIPGFMLPLEYGDGGEVVEFLLVPYFGACVHVPPPPPNQIVFVDTMGDPVTSKGMWDPIWAIGTLRTKPNMNGLGDTAYTLELAKIETYED